MYVHYNTLLYSFIHLCLSLSLMLSDLSAPEGDLVWRSTGLEGVLDRKRLTVQAIGTIRSDQYKQIELIKNKPPQDTFLFTFRFNERTFRDIVQ